MEILAQKLLLHVANKQRITEPQAAKYINKCLAMVSAEENIDYNIVYDTFHTFSGLSLCLAKSCTVADLEECEKLCHCVVFKSVCVPRYLPEAIEINEDPDKWIKGVKTSDLESLVEYASYLYYNYDGGGLTDNSFDALEYHLNKRLKTKGRRWEKIGAEPVEKLKTKLPYPMPSLEKIKPEMSTLFTFLSQSKESGMVWSGKLDGVSGMVVFKGKKIEGIYTRGNGEIGGDVTYLKDYITLPKPTYEYLVVRGEFILSKRVWEEKYKGSYANARSFVSAKINTGYISAELPDIQFLAYQIIDWSEKHTPPPSQAFKILQEQGFTVPENGVFETVLVFDVITKYKDQRETSDFNIDGLVLVLNRAGAIAKAFKMSLEEQKRRTRVLNVDWNITRHGRYFPVAVFESVYVDGVRLHRASAHNAAHVNDWYMGKGTQIVVTRSGDVIPTIKDVTVNEKILPILPGGEYTWHWSDSSKDILLDDIEGNPEVQIKRITHFFTTIQTPQLGEGRVRKLYGAGYDTLKSITSASVADLKKIKGFGDKLSRTIYDNIHNTMRKTRMDRYFVAITTFKSKVGRKTLKTVIRQYPGLLTASSKEITQHLSQKKNKIPGIGPAKIKSLAESVPKFRNVLLNLDRQDIKYALKHQEQSLEELYKSGYNTKIKGKTFVTTGFIGGPDYDLEDYIWDHWGELASTVTTNTTAVISANVANITGKMLKANELHVPVYSIKEFISAFDIPIRPQEQEKLVIAEENIAI